jgi:hypothetical protein
MPIPGPRSRLCQPNRRRDGRLALGPLREIGKTGLTAYSCGKFTVLRCCVNGELVERRGDNVRGLNLGRSFDKSCHRLQHLGIGIGVVRFGIGLLFQQSDCSHINSPGPANVISSLKPFCLRSKGRTVVLKCARVIGKSIGFQMNRDIACKHGNLLRLGFC